MAAGALLTFPRALPPKESGAKQAFELEGQSAQKVAGSIMQFSRQLQMKAQLAEAGLGNTKLSTVYK